MASPTRFRVGIVGSGPAGAALGAALARAGHHVVATPAGSDDSVARAHPWSPTIAITGDPASVVVGDADLVLLAGPGSQLPDLIEGLAVAGAFRPGQIVVHTTPEHGIGVLEPAGADVLPLALHPCTVFTGGPEDLDRLTGAVVAVTTLRTLRPLGEALCLELGGEPVWVEEEDRPTYAAALAAVRDGLSRVLTAAAHVLADCGIPETGRALGQLANAIVEQTLRTGSVATASRQAAAGGTAGATDRARQPGDRAPADAPRERTGHDPADPEEQS